MKRLMTLLLGALAISASCNKQDPPNGSNGEPDLTPVEIEYPGYVPILDVPAGNETTEEGVALGRMIYYDKMLSQGGPLHGNACGSCHQQEYGFTTPGPKSPPVMPHVNLGWNHAYLWNGAEGGTLEDVMVFEVRDFFEADLSLFQAEEAYTNAFEEIYGDDAITYERMGKMLAQFLRTVNSFNSPVDKALKGEGFLSESEVRGFDIFNSETGDCFHCHSQGLFTDGAFHNTGLDSIFSGYDAGRYVVTGNKNDMGKFKTPTLRNVALRGPYMHDGRFETLEEVVEFYNSGVKESPTLDPIMTKPGKESGLNLTAQQKTDLVNFMKALTDTTFINNPKISKP